MTPYNGLANRRLQPLGHISKSGKAYRDFTPREERTDKNVKQDIAERARRDLADSLVLADAAFSTRGGDIFLDGRVEYPPGRDAESRAG